MMSRFSRHISTWILAAGLWFAGVSGGHGQEPAAAPGAAPAVAAPPAPAADAVPTPSPASTPGAKPAAPAPPAVETYPLREKGIHAMNDGIPEAAIRFFSRYRDLVVGREPAFTDATVLLVEACLRGQKPDQAAAALAFHQAHSPGIQDPRLQDAFTYWTAAVLLAQGRYAESVKTANPLLAPGRTPAYRRLAMKLIGNAYAHLKQWNGAEEMFRKLLHEFPDAPGNDRVSVQLAKVLISEGKLQDAEQTLAGIKIKPGQAGDIAVRIALCRILIALHRNDVDKALQAYRAIAGERPVRSDPDWWLVVSQLSQALIRAKKYPAAVEVLPQALALAPTEKDRLQVRLHRIDCLVALGKSDEAIAALEQFKKDYPGMPELFPAEFRLAQLFRQTKNYQAATEYFAQVARAETAPKELRYQAALQNGWCLSEAGNDTAAVRAFADAAGLGTTDSEKARALLLAGDAAYRVGNYTDAALYDQTVADKYKKTPFAEEARYKQALARSQAKLFSSAAAIYQLYLKEYPKGQFVDKARLERGIALKNAGDFPRAARELAALAADHPQSPLAPRALLEAAESARSADNVTLALTLYSRLIDKYPESDLFPHALYQRAHLYFFLARFPKAVADCTRFLAKFPGLPMATDVLFWLGDYYNNTGDLAKAAEYYRRLESSHPDSPDAARALYEAAVCLYKQDDLVQADLLVRQLERRYPNASAHVRALATLLAGDVLAKQGKYAEAAKRFQQAAVLGAGTAVENAATGRLGDMEYSLGTAGNAEAYAKAKAAFIRIIHSPVASADQVEMAKYRLGKTLEKMGDVDAAVTEYLDVFYQYRMDLRRKQMRDWYYFARSGFDVARLLIREKRYREAVRVYDRLARSGVPTAADARAKARELRAMLQAARAH